LFFNPVPGRTVWVGEVIGNNHYRLALAVIGRRAVIGPEGGVATSLKMWRHARYVRITAFRSFLGEPLANRSRTLGCGERVDHYRESA
jgi:hypothetical protein